ncbi:hypothetical protein [Haladaptatus sp. W1]|uniref:hypothetical protein n=1 Tax=Haladaptatus sp. W1 TaxID=1897478 RepID=UPI0020C81316|nr:hypothetical protein [Haladaptatus sp. W1]
MTHPDLTVTDGESRTGGRVIALIGLLLSMVVIIDLFLRAESVWFPEFIIEMTLSAMLVFDSPSVTVRSGWVTRIRRSLFPLLAHRYYRFRHR